MELSSPLRVEPLSNAPESLLQMGRIGFEPGIWNLAPKSEPGTRYSKPGTQAGTRNQEPRKLLTLLEAEALAPLLERDGAVAVDVAPANG